MDASHQNAVQLEQDPPVTAEALALLGLIVSLSPVVRLIVGPDMLGGFVIRVLGILPFILGNAEGEIGAEAVKKIALQGFVRVLVGPRLGKDDHQRSFH